MKKKKILKLVSVALAAVLAVGSMAGCGKKTTSSDEISYYIIASESKDTSWILEEVNKEVKAKTGISVNFKILTNDNYDLTLSSGEEFDLIYAPDYLNFWQNAEKGAFAEISDDDIKQYMPYVWENGGEKLNAAKYKGVRYAIPAFQEGAPDRCFVARGDLMEKYGIENLDSIEAVEEYLTKVKENEPDMIPFDMPGGAAYSLLQMVASDWGWSGVGSVGFGAQVYYRYDDPEHKVFIAAEQPEMLEFTKMMKRWNDKGFFSMSVLSNKISSLDSFKGGRSALGLVANPAECQTVYDELMKDDRASWKPYFTSRYHKHQQVNAVTGNMVAVSAFSEKKDKALTVLNEMLQNEKLVRLLTYGVEGTHYEIDDKGYRVDLDTDSKGWMTTGIGNGEFGVSTELTFPGAEELVKKFSDIRVVNPTVNHPMSYEGIREIQVALSEVYNQYTSPRYYGVIKGTPEEAIAEELKALKAAGIDQFVESLQNQLDEYFESTSK